MDDVDLARLLEQAEARIQDELSGNPAAFERYIARIRQRPDGQFEKRAPNGEWYYYTPGGFPFGAREVDALRARGDKITADNVSVQFP